MKGEGETVVCTYVCGWVREREREAEGGKASSQGGRWDEGEVLGRRLKKHREP